jgi:kynurenine formamidase
MTTEFTELDEANRKVQEWKREARQSTPVHLSSGIDISLSPADPQHVLPHLSPFQVLRTADILTKLVQLPSITSTSVVSIGFGALVTLLLTFHRRHYAEFSRLEVISHGAGKLVRLVLCLVAALVYLRYLRRRYPAVLPVSQYQNLSRVPEGPCFVANRVLTMSNSQVGTHADGPHHFCRSLSHRNYDDAHYSGDAVVLDLSADLAFPSADTEPHAITVEMMERACARLPAAYRDKSKPLWRLLLVTQRGPDSRARDTTFLSQSLNVLLENNEVQQAQKSFRSSTPLPAGSTNNRNPYAFLYPEVVEYLHRVFPHLLLIGIDAPSVDPTDVMPLVSHCHGAMLRCGMAIVESLRFNRLRPLLESGVNGQKGVLVGSMLTVFITTQNFDDARGCSVVFFPGDQE